MAIRGGGTSRSASIGFRSSLAKSIVVRRDLSPIVEVTQPRWDGKSTATALIDSNDPPRPQLMLIEIYGVSSFLGDYGAGRTVRTFTLLPGEETKISIKTWRSTEASYKEASSIIDSQNESSSERFGDKVQSETSVKSNDSQKEGWHAEAKVEQGWGTGDVEVSGGGSGEYQSSREEFGKRVSDATAEHAREASNKRDTSVSSSSEKTDKSGEESLTERTIKNVNMRRTLNFVFRELNQAYDTYIHLMDVRVAFTNGRAGSYEEVPLSGMRRFLDKYVVTAQVEAMARYILRVVGTVFDHADAPVRMIEQVVMSDDGADWTIGAPALTNGALPVPPSDGSWFYRVRRGPLNQENTSNAVAGVVLKKNRIVMKTDSVIIEALLGQADALDPYAMIVQESAAEARVLANSREKLAQDTLTAIQDPEKRAAAFAAMFNAVPAKP